MIENFSSFMRQKYFLMLMVSATFSAAFVFIFPQKLLAAAQDVVITEIMYNAPDSDSGREWVELANFGAESVTIVGGTGVGSWRFVDKSNHVFAKEPARGSNTIASGERIIVAQDAAQFIADYPAYAGSVLEVGAMDLPNVSATPGLRIGTSGVMWSATLYNFAMGGNGNGKTLELVNGAWRESLADGGTPGGAGQTNATTNATANPQPPTTDATATAQSSGLQQPTPSDLSSSAASSLSSVASPSMAAAGEVVINELMTDPETGGREWVELFNKSGRDINLSEWKLEDGAGIFGTLSGTLAASGAGQFFVSEIWPNRLNNSGDIIILRGASGAVMDSVTYGTWDDGLTVDNAPLPKKGEALARVKDGHDTESDAGNFTATNYPTRGAANVISSANSELSLLSAPANIQQPAEAASLKEAGARDSATSSTPRARAASAAGIILIFEIFPDPEESDADEWIELYNVGGETVDLAGLTLDDGEGGSNPYIFKRQTIVEPRGYYLAKRAETKIILNNTEDSVRIFYNGELLDSISYQAARRGESYARFPGGWQWTAASTPGEANALPPKTPAQNLSGKKPTTSVAASAGKLVEDIADLFTAPLGTRVSAAGFVTVEPGLFSSQMFWLADAGGNGIAVYMYKKDFPPLRRGAAVAVKGEISEARGIRRVKIKTREDISIARGETEKLEIPLTPTSDIKNISPGAIIAVEGELIESRRDGFVIDDGAGDIFVLPRTADSRGQIFSVGVRLRVTGIVGVSKGEPALLPRDKSDFVLIAEQKEEDKKRAPLKSSAAATVPLAAAGGAAAGIFSFRRRLAELIKSLLARRQ